VKIKDVNVDDLIELPLVVIKKSWRKINSSKHLNDVSKLQRRMNILKGDVQC